MTSDFDTFRRLCEQLESDLAALNGKIIEDLEALGIEPALQAGIIEAFEEDAKRLPKE